MKFAANPGSSAGRGFRMILSGYFLFTDGRWPGLPADRGLPGHAVGL